jgi:hypothetical protein
MWSWVVARMEPPGRSRPVFDTYGAMRGFGPGLRFALSGLRNLRSLVTFCGGPCLQFVGCGCWGSACSLDGGFPF